MSRFSKIRRGLHFLDQREHFLPVKLVDLQARMLEDGRLSPLERQLLGKLFQMIAQRFHLEYRERLEHLKTIYEPFDPDLDVRGAGGEADTDPTLRRLEVSAAFERLLRDANFDEMSRDEITACTEFQANRNITVRASFRDYAELRIFYRGVKHETRRHGSWYWPWPGKEETIHVFSRLALLVRLVKRQPEAVFLKLFKNVVAEDLEMLLPFVRIRMRLFDQLKIGGSFLGGIATASWKVWTAAVMSPWLVLAVGSAFVGACVKSVTDFVASKTHYVHKLTTNLYFQNLANNGSMLAHVIDSAENEECKELLLAYFLLYVERNRNYTAERLDRRAEQWLATEFGIHADFDISGAVKKLTEKGLVVQRSSSQATDGPFSPVLKVYDLPSSLHRLDAEWDAFLAGCASLVDGRHQVADEEWPPYAATGPSDAVTIRVDPPAHATPPVASQAAREPKPA